MEAEFKFSQRFVTPLIGILLNMAKKMTFGPKSAIFNQFDAHFQQYTCLFTTLTAFRLLLEIFKIFKQKKKRAILL